MDPHYVHPSWGVTPGLDLLKVAQVVGGNGNVRKGPEGKDGGGEGGIAVLQVAPADCRHSASVLASFALRSSSTKTRTATTLDDGKCASVQEEGEERTSASGEGAIDDADVVGGHECGDGERPCQIESHDTRGCGQAGARVVGGRAGHVTGMARR